MKDGAMRPSIRLALDLPSIATRFISSKILDIGTFPLLIARRTRSNDWSSNVPAIRRIILIGRVTLVSHVAHVQNRGY